MYISADCLTLRRIEVRQYHEGSPSGKRVPLLYLHLEAGPNTLALHLPLDIANDLAKEIETALLDHDHQQAFINASGPIEVLDTMPRQPG